MHEAMTAHSFTCVHGSLFMYSYERLQNEKLSKVKLEHQFQMCSAEHAAYLHLWHLHAYTLLQIEIACVDVRAVHCGRVAAGLCATFYICGHHVNLYLLPEGAWLLSAAVWLPASLAPSQL